MPFLFINFLNSKIVFISFVQFFFAVPTISSTLRSLITYVHPISLNFLIKTSSDQFNNISSFKCRIFVISFFTRVNIWGWLYINRLHFHGSMIYTVVFIFLSLITHILFGLKLNSSQIIWKALVIVVSFSSFKGTIHAYLLKIFITYNKKTNSFVKFAYELHISKINTPSIIYKRWMHFKKKKKEISFNSFV